MTKEAGVPTSVMVPIHRVMAAVREVRVMMPIVAVVTIVTMMVVMVVLVVIKDYHPAEGEEAEAAPEPGRLPPPPRGGGDPARPPIGVIAPVIIGVICRRRG